MSTDNVTVSFIGELCGATGFDTKAIFAKWRLVVGDANWKHLSGDTSGQTWTAERDMCDEMAIWNQPIDVSFAAVGLQGWPKIVLEIYETDSNNCVDLVGYGTCTLPLSPGLHQREVVVSRPRGSWTDDFQSSFLGGYPRYMHPDVITLGDSRFGHETISTGVAHLSVHVATKNLEDYVRLLPDSTQKGDTNTSVCHRCPARVNTERAEINFGI